MFDISIKAGVLKEWMKRLNVASDEFKLVVNPEGLYAKLVDPAHVLMLETSLDKSAFESFTLKDDGGLDGFYVDLGYFKMPFKFSNPADKIRVAAPWNEDTVSEKVDPYFHIEYAGVEREHSIHPEDLEGQYRPWDFKIPNLDKLFKNKLSISTIALRKILEDIKEGSDHCVFKCTKEGLTVMRDICDHTEKGTRVKKLFKAEALDGYFYTEDTKTIFSLDYLLKCIKSLPNPNITIELATDSPIRITWDQISNQAIVGHGYYLLAPRIEND